jgi:hypothetical protein
MASPPSAEPPANESLVTVNLAAPKPTDGSELPATTPRGRGAVLLPGEVCPLTTPAGRQFGKFELLEVIAQGGMGVVYKAEDTSLRRTVALKMIRSGFVATADEVRRFRQEAQAAAPLHHPHIISIYEIGEQDGYHYFTMPLAVGGSLAGRMGGLHDEPRAAVLLMEKIARAVHTAHRHGILHRDLKPANVLLDEQGEPLIADFGLAKLLDGGPALTDPGLVMGTPAYLSPEQAVGRSDLFGPATDVWALGVILFEMLTGRRPFTTDDRGELISNILTGEPPRPRDLRPEVDGRLEAVVLKCLRKEPSQRYASAEALADDLSRWLRGEPLADDSTSLSPARRGLVFAALGLLLVAIVALAVGYFQKDDRPPGPPEGEVAQREPPLVLVDETGGPRHKYRWIRGGANAEVLALPGQPLAFRAKEFALLELLKTPPWPRYRLEAEIRHNESWDQREPVVGLFFAHRLYAEGLGKFLGFFQATFNEGQSNGQLRLSFSTDQGVGLVPEYRLVLNTPLPMIPAWQPDTPRLWRQIAVEVTPEEVRLFHGAKHLDTIVPAKLQANPRPKIGGRPIEVQPQLGPGGLGLLVYEGRGSFRNVVVKPLP